MPNLPSPKQRFTDQQISAILRRAVELQAERSDAEGASGASAGFSLQQLQQAAAELGIEPRWIEEAAAELEGGSPCDGRASFWGGPSLVVIERVVEGTVTDEDWPAVLQQIRNATGLVGTTNRVGGSFEWMGLGGAVVHVTVTPRGGKTAIRVMSRHSDWAGLYYIGSGTAGIVGSLILASVLGWSPLADLGLSAGLFTGLFAAARSGFNSLCQRKARGAQELMRALERTIARPARSSAPALASVTTVEVPAEQVLGGKD